MRRAISETDNDESTSPAPGSEVNLTDLPDVLGATAALDPNTAMLMQVVDLLRFPFLVRRKR